MGVCVKKTLSPKVNICGPIGGFINHVRWLMLLDPQIEFTIQEPNSTIPIHTLDTIDSKIDFISNQIYSESRTWNNWLYVEFLYRLGINQIINIAHYYDEIENKNLNTLFLTASPELSYFCYLKFNSNLNISLPEVFKLKNHKLNEYHKRIALESTNITVVDSDILFQPTLDQNFYNNLVSWANITNLYDHANKIHGLWYSAHKRAEQEFIEHVSTVYK
jgi:hypothetical protein